MMLTEKPVPVFFMPTIIACSRMVTLGRVLTLRMSLSRISAPVASLWWKMRWRQ